MRSPLLIVGIVTVSMLGFLPLAISQTSFTTVTLTSTLTSQPSTITTATGPFTTITSSFTSTSSLMINLTSSVNSTYTLTSTLPPQIIATTNVTSSPVDNTIPLIIAGNVAALAFLILAARRYMKRKRK